MAWWWDTPLRTQASQSFAGAEHASRVLQIALNIHCERMRAPEHAPRDPFYLLEPRNGLAEIVERGAIVHVKRLRVKHPYRSINALRADRRARRQLCVLAGWTLRRDFFIINYATLQAACRLRGTDQCL